MTCKHAQLYCQASSMLTYQLEEELLVETTIWHICQPKFYETIQDDFDPISDRLYSFLGVNNKIAHKSQIWSINMGPRSLWAMCPLGDVPAGGPTSKQPLQVQSLLLHSLQGGQIVWQTQTPHSVEDNKRSLGILLSLRVYSPFNGACITELGWRFAATGYSSFWPELFLSVRQSVMDSLIKVKDKEWELFIVFGLSSFWSKKQEKNGSLI